MVLLSLSSLSYAWMVCCGTTVLASVRLVSMMSVRLPLSSYVKLWLLDGGEGSWQGMVGVGARSRRSNRP